jgi:hypothetical protein
MKPPLEYQELLELQLAVPYSLHKRRAGSAPIQSEQMEAAHIHGCFFEQMDSRLS